MVGSFKNQNSTRYKPALDIERGKARYTFANGAVFEDDLRIKAKSLGSSIYNEVEFPALAKFKHRNNEKPDLVKLEIGANNKNNRRLTQVHVYFNNLKELYVDRGYSKVDVRSDSIEYIWLPDDTGKKFMDLDVGPNTNGAKIKAPLSLKVGRFDSRAEIINLDDLFSQEDTEDIDLEFEEPITLF